MNEDFLFCVSSWQYRDEYDELYEDIDDNNTYSNKYNKKFVIRLFGRTEKGKSVTVSVTDYKPSFYIKLNEKYTKLDIAALYRNIQDMMGNFSKTIIGYEIDKFHDLYEHFCNEEKFIFMKLDFNSIEGYNFCKRKLNYQTFNINSRIHPIPKKFETYEHKMMPIFDFIHNNNIASANWNILKGGKYKKDIINKTTTDYTFTINWKHVTGYDGPEKKLAPFKILSFDIECTSGDGSFPQASRITDKIISIGSVLTTYGKDDIDYQHMISLNTCSSIPNTEIVECENEKDVLLQWKKLIQKLDPDFIIGFNIFGFDIDFMKQRAALPSINCLEEFSKLGRISTDVCNYKELYLGSSGLGDNYLKFFEISGREQIDVMKMAQQDFKLVSYSLDKVAETLLKTPGKVIDKRYSEDYEGFRYEIETDVSKIKKKDFVKIDIDGFMTNDKFLVSAVKRKENIIIIYMDEDLIGNNTKINVSLAKDDIKPAEMFASYAQGPDERARINKYCIQDCALVSKILNKMDLITQRMAMGNVCHVPFGFIITKGQGIKCLSLFGKTCKAKKYLIKDIKPPPKDIENEGYEGAIVFEPLKGMHDNATVLDFNSLYPSMEMADDMSHETLVKDEKYLGLPEYYYRTETYLDNDGEEITQTFATKKCNVDSKGNQIKGKYGIVGSILDMLITERKKAKKEMNKANDPVIKKVFNGKQLALKITANSIYGQLGAGVSPIRCKEIAAATTAGGRRMLILAKDHAEKDFPKILNKLYKCLKKNNMEKFNEILDDELEDRENIEFIEGLKKDLLFLFDNFTINIKVIYGDTDSNFFNYNLKLLNGKIPPFYTRLKWNYKIGLIQSKFLKIRLPSPHNMEFEKVITPTVLLEKKSYLGNKYEEFVNIPELDLLESQGKFNEIDEFSKTVDVHYYGKFSRLIMGYALKRRDSCVAFHKILSKAIDIVLNENNVEKSINFLKQELKNIIDGKYSIWDFVTTKTLSSKYKGLKMTTTPNGKKDEKGTWAWDDVKCGVAHVRLCQKMKQRDPGNVPNVNDRIAFVNIMHENKKKMLQGELIETPDYVLSNNCRIDYLHYITNQFRNNTVLFFKVVYDGIEKIFDDIEKEENEKNALYFTKLNAENKIKHFSERNIDIKIDNSKSFYDHDNEINFNYGKANEIKHTRMLDYEKSREEEIIKNMRRRNRKMRKEKEEEIIKNMRGSKMRNDKTDV